ncbi:hypothetical protein BJ138DRAFT_1130381 [Hygrophoropsis aurantiaca]|uniref:Uncharacterized protein n=1 Tax=Hygrophoropsis aurantiaca TaxID=72124 RepID=A0ACB7ZX48_9AGAM|nr:hypothetical protein BJ138DRAFT_1130381 [Hygrophoropsis aurantiaca]
MDAKLKSLKVVELRDILIKASAPAQAKANKQDLINKILATPTAIQIYHQQYPSPQSKKAPSSAPAPLISDDLASPCPLTLRPTLTHVALQLAPPEDVDWIVEEHDVSALTPIPAPPQPTKPPSQSSSTVDTSSIPSTIVSGKPSSTQGSAPPPQDATSTDTIDQELVRRKARAERFGIPLVEVKKSRQPQSKKTPQSQTSTNGGATPDDPEKLDARAARFGVAKSTNKPQSRSGQKRAAPAEEVDVEELERRKKRAERFGIPTNAAT